jgi:hypothetical protein
VGNQVVAVGTTIATAPVRPPLSLLLAIYRVASSRHAYTLA